jgi:hypothetical protein
MPATMSISTMGAIAAIGRVRFHCRSPSAAAQIFQGTARPSRYLNTLHAHLLVGSDNLVDANTLPAQGGPDQPEISQKTLGPNILRIDLGEPN